jgi:pentose-5-phosphate-3-epimerase
MRSSLERITALQYLPDERALAHVEIRVDGGVPQATIGSVAPAGATSTESGAGLGNYRPRRETS